MTTATERLTDEQVNELIAKHGIVLDQPVTEHLLGDFQLGEAVRLTDPCYTADTWCAGTVDNISAGIWTAYNGTRPDSSDIRSSLAWIYHSAELIMADLRAEMGLSEPFDKEEFTKQKIAKIVAHPGRSNWIVAVKKGHEHLITNDEVGKRNLMEALKVEGFQLDIHVGVDSGQAGVFDLQFYKTLDSLSRDERDTAFYSPVCDLTCDTPVSAGVVAQGCVSSSGFGDGGYASYALRDGNNQVIAIGIEFIGLSEEDEEVEEEG